MKEAINIEEHIKFLSFVKDSIETYLFMQCEYTEQEKKEDIQLIRKLLMCLRAQQNNIYAELETLSESLPTPPEVVSAEIAQTTGS